MMIGRRAFHCPLFTAVRTLRDNLGYYHLHQTLIMVAMLIRVSRCSREAPVLQVRGGLWHSWLMCKQFEQRPAAAFYGVGRSCRRDRYIRVGQVT